MYFSFLKTVLYRYAMPVYYGSKLGYSGLPGSFWKLYIWCYRNCENREIYIIWYDKVIRSLHEILWNKISLQQKIPVEENLMEIP